MTDIPFLSVEIQGLLSFGAKGLKLDLLPLNVLIGPNGSGKSNFIDALRFMLSSATDLVRPVSFGGNSSAWFWCGAKSGSPAIVTLDVDLERNGNVRHSLSLGANGPTATVVREGITVSASGPPYPGGIVYALDGYSAVINAVVNDLTDPTNTNSTYPTTVPSHLSLGDLDFTQSILTQRIDPLAYPVPGELRKLYRDARFYGDVRLGRDALSRLPQSADGEADGLHERGGNLAIVINQLQTRPESWKKLLAALKQFNERYEHVNTTVGAGGALQIFMVEHGLQNTVPATRLSDGTMRFLQLLAVLLDPNPAALVCIEEPEIGMHPDILPTIAELLLDASRRMQIIVTTHSDLLVSCLRSVPEAIVVCECGDDGTTMRRLTEEDVSRWPKDLSLGELWLKGAIGGTRW